MKSLRTGASRPLTLFSDGSFYETGLQAGEYEVIGEFDGAAGREESAVTRLSLAPAVDPVDEGPPHVADLVVTLGPSAEPG